jgi:anaerobic magnesium-protoporphyrin IX monomethyl ester cyclase
VRYIKAEFPELKIVFGGPHVTSLPEETMKENPLLDFGVIGEGEYTMLELAENHDPNAIKGLIHRNRDEVIFNPPRALISNLDELPHPARHLLPSRQLYEHTPTRDIKGKTISMITSRGCPFGCLYCHQIFGKTWRPHSVDYIFEEIESLDDRYDLISFEDDNFGLERERLHEFCRRKIESDFDFKWNCYLRLDGVDERTIDLMKRAGCNCIFFGIESGNSKILDFVEKKITLELIKEKIRVVKRNGIDAYGSFIIGLPTETTETIEQTIRLATSLPLDGITVNLFTPYPKTALREIAADYGTLSSNWSDYNDHSPRPPFVPHGMTADELLALQKAAYRRFYVRPKYVLTHLDKVLNAGFVKKSLLAVKVLLEGR